MGRKDQMIHWTWLILAVVVTGTYTILAMTVRNCGKKADDQAEWWRVGHQEGYHIGFHVGYRKGFHARSEKAKKDGQTNEPD